ncbi:MAG: VOC family protein [Candidatus Kapabacteria bacterium]|nr:VOC family protein [Candidatus Kapabacteria bacterium]
MSEIHAHKPASFCWVDYMANDPDGAIKFYSDLFGWEARHDNSTGGPVYSIFHLKGKAVAASMEMPADMKALKVPSCWIVYVCSSKVEDDLNKARQNGALILHEADDIPTQGRWGLFQDPEGAVIGLWEPQKHIGSNFKDEHGSFCWFEHGSHSADNSMLFYSKVFGWSSKKEQMAGMDYTTILNGVDGIGGVYTFNENMQDVPPNWLVYFAINDIDAACEKIISFGGSVIMPKMHIEGVGAFGIFTDNQGGVFGLLQG